MDPIPLTPPPPAKPTQPGQVAVMAMIGFLAYAGVGWLTLRVFRGNFSLLAILLLAAFVMGIKGVWRGFALGVLLGIGLTLLLVGACFAMFAMK